MFFQYEATAIEDWLRCFVFAVANAKSEQRFYFMRRIETYY